MENTDAKAKIADYADRFLYALERIADALEGRKPQTASVSTPDASASLDASHAAPTVAQGSIPYDDVRKAIMAYSDTHGAAAAQAVLKKFGAKYLLDLKAKPEVYAEVLAALK